MLTRAYFMSAVVFTAVGTALAPAEALTITIDSVVIDDNGNLDLDRHRDHITFQSNSRTAPFATNSKYEVKGVVKLGTGDALARLLDGGAKGISLTSLIVDAVDASTLNAPLTFEAIHAFGGPSRTVKAADAIEARVRDGTGAATFEFNQNTALDIPPAADAIISFNGFINGKFIQPEIGGPPPINSPQYRAGVHGERGAPYAFYGHGPMEVNDISPDLRLKLTIGLGMRRDQFILRDSAEVGFVVIPEPTTLLLVGSGLIGVIARRRSTERRNETGSRSHLQSHTRRPQS